jgi:hypothetical protein
VAAVIGSIDTIEVTRAIAYDDMSVSMVNAEAASGAYSKPEAAASCRNYA